MGQRGQQYPHLALGPVPKLWLKGRLPGSHSELFSHMKTPRLVPQISRENEFPPNIDPREPFYNPHTVSSLNVAWLLSCGAPVLGAPGTDLLCPLSPWGPELRLATWRPPSSCTPGFSIKWISPEYWPRGRVPTGFFYNPHTVPIPGYEFPRVPAPVGQRG